jgi:beta-1,2-mannobiose phosphorylase / 1,2-beta-oligomannan phosphorylase
MRHHKVFPLTLFLACVCGSNAFTIANDHFPKELTHFAPGDSNPVFTAQGDGHWDVKIRERGWILFDPAAPSETPTWRMWYTGYNGSREGLKKLGLATSYDGLKWTPHPKNPIYAEAWVEDFMIVPHESMLYMFAEGLADQAELLTSPDGINWKRVGPLDVRMTDGKPIEPGTCSTKDAIKASGWQHLAT